MSVQSHHFHRCLEPPFSQAFRAIIFISVQSHHFHRHSKPPFAQAFRAQSSRPRVDHLIYGPKSFFPHRALSLRHRVVSSLSLQPHVSIFLSSCVRTKSLVFFFQFFGTVHFVPLIVYIFTHIPYTRDLYRRGAYLQTLNFVPLAYVFKFTSVLHSSSLVAHSYSYYLPFLSHLRDFG